MSQDFPYIYGFFLSNNPSSSFQISVFSQWKCDLYVWKHYYASWIRICSQNAGSGFDQQNRNTAFNWYVLHEYILHTFGLKQFKTDGWVNSKLLFYTYFMITLPVLHKPFHAAALIHCDGVLHYISSLYSITVLYSEQDLMTNWQFFAEYKGSAVQWSKCVSTLEPDQ